MSDGTLQIEDSTSTDFLVQLALSLHRYGAPAFRLEEDLRVMASHLGMQAQVMSLPTSLLLGFGPEGHQHTTLLRVDPGDPNLGKLSAVNQVANRVLHDDLDPSQAFDELRAINEDPATLANLGQFLSFPLFAGTTAALLGGSWMDAATACVAGLLIASLSLLARRSVAGGNVFELVAATLASIVVHSASQFFQGINYQIALLGSVICLVPGLTFTVAMLEVATRNLVSGTARLMQAAIVFLEIICGIAVSQRLLSQLWRAPGVPDDHIAMSTPLIDLLALLLAGLGGALLFRAAAKDLAKIIFVCTVAFACQRLGASLSPEFGAFVGGFVATCLANLYMRWTNQSALVLLVPGILLLVPGSIGFRSLTFFWQEDPVSGVSAGFNMVLLGISLVAGLLAANAAVPAKRKNHA